MSPNLQSLIERYENGVQVFEDALRDVNPQTIDRTPAPGKWSIRQIAVHLVDADLVAAARMRWVAAEPGSPLPAWDQDMWASKLPYQQQSLEDCLALFRAIRKTTATMLRQLPEATWANTGMHAERGRTSVLELVELYAGHAENHARQIRELRSKFAAAA